MYQLTVFGSRLMGCCFCRGSAFTVAHLTRAVTIDAGLALPLIQFVTADRAGLYHCEGCGNITDFQLLFGVIMFRVTDVGSGTGVGSLGMTPVATSSGRVRACLEAVLVNCVMSVLQPRLTEAGLIRSFIDVEMPSLIILAKMELNGFGTNLIFELQKSLQYRPICYKLLLVL